MPPWRPAIGEALTFIPEAGHETWKKKVARSFENSTRYLFRVYDGDSLGSTTEIYVSSPLAKSGSPSRHRNLLDQPAKEAADNLNRHLRWKSSHHTKTNLVSWTSSVLFAIQYALYKHYRDADGSVSDSTSQVRILMIDTSRFPEGTFIRDLEVLSCLKNRSFPIKQLYRLRTSEDGYSFGEYLSQGCINVTGACGTIRLDQLLQSNFRGPDVCPYFARVADWSTLAKRVVSIRKLVEESKGEHASLAQIL
ncbi:hypothetical protein K456DRAFT_36269 [Colletotrichum gloeosporioides 23]|nr:hypothetical protein K456DRAFT_36269 [Colletotrichum gloeosporioides 23]